MRDVPLDTSPNYPPFWSLRSHLWSASLSPPSEGTDDVYVKTLNDYRTHGKMVPFERSRKNGFPPQASGTALRKRRGVNHTSDRDGHVFPVHTSTPQRHDSDPHGPGWAVDNTPSPHLPAPGRPLARVVYSVQRRHAFFRKRPDGQGNVGSHGETNE